MICDLWEAAHRRLAEHRHRGCGGGGRCVSRLPVFPPANDWARSVLRRGVAVSWSSM